MWTNNASNFSLNNLSHFLYSFPQLSTAASPSKTELLWSESRAKKSLPVNANYQSCYSISFHFSISFHILLLLYLAVPRPAETSFLLKSTGTERIWHNFELIFTYIRLLALVCHGYSIFSASLAPCLQTYSFTCARLYVLSRTTPGLCWMNVFSPNTVRDLWRKAVIII